MKKLLSLLVSLALICSLMGAMTTAAFAASISTVKLHSIWTATRDGLEVDSKTNGAIVTNIQYAKNHVAVETMEPGQIYDVAVTVELIGSSTFASGVTAEMDGWVSVATLKGSKDSEKRFIFTVQAPYIQKNSYTLTKGEYFFERININSEYSEPERCTSTGGKLPDGMEFGWSGQGIYLRGTPTKSGNYTQYYAIRHVEKNISTYLTLQIEVKDEQIPEQKPEPAPEPVPQTPVVSDSEVWVGGVKVTEANRMDVLGDGRVSYDPAANLLTLNGAMITKGSVFYNSYSGIYCDKSLNINLVGENYVMPAAISEDLYSSGIFVNTLVLCGSGSLVVQAPDSLSKNNYGIETSHRLLCKDSVDVTVYAGTAKFSAECCAIYGDLLIEENARVKAISMNGGLSQVCFGVHTNYEVYVVGGSLEVQAKTAAAYNPSSIAGNIVHPVEKASVLVNKNAAAEGAVSWNGSDILGGNAAEFKYLKITAPKKDAGDTAALANAKPGDILVMGRCAQGHTGISPNEPIQWLVLDTQPGKVLVISRFGLFHKPFNTGSGSNTWDNSTLRTYLNQDFINASFTEAQRSRILSTSVSAETNPRYNLDPGKDTVDRLFLLSISEVQKYLPTRAAQTVADYTKKESIWWLRNPGATEQSPTYAPVGKEGFFFGNNSADSMYVSVRPAMWLSTTGRNIDEPALPNVKPNPAPQMPEPEAPAAPTQPETPKEQTTPFVDVPKDAYYYDATVWAFNAEPQITDGNGKDKFMPEQICTRGQVVTFLWRAAGCPEPKSSKNPFTDVKSSDYFYKPVLWAVENGITDGTSPDKFSPSNPCKNSHILTFIWRALGEPDKTGAGTWYTDAYNWAVKNHLLDGTYTGKYDINAQCPRKNVVQYLYVYYTMK